MYKRMKKDKNTEQQTATTSPKAKEIKRKKCSGEIITRS